MIRMGIGQDSHRFLKAGSDKKCVIAGLVFDDAPGLDADSDGDVVFHSICNAITSVTHVQILGGAAIEMCKAGITDSAEYLKKAIEGVNIVHVAVTIEAKMPRMQKRAFEMRQRTADVMGLQVEDVGITFTSGDGLSDFARGDGLQAFAVVSIDI